MHHNRSVYRGAEGFHEDVLPKLREKYLSGNLETGNLMMVWIPGVGKLRSLKIAIGSKIILKYRLQFYTSVRPTVKTLAKSSIELFKGEPETINQMTVWQNRQFEPPEMLIE